MTMHILFILHALCACLSEFYVNFVYNFIAFMYKNWHNCVIDEKKIDFRVN